VSSRRSFFRLLLLLVVLAVSPAADAATPTVRFDARSVALTGLTPSGNVAWTSVSREPRGFSTLVASRSGVATADALGEATIELDGEVATASVWVVVDLGEGGFTVAAPEGTSFREIGFDGRSVVANPQGKLNRLVHARPYVELFLARPGVGAWAMTAGEGAEGDDDGEQDGSLHTRLASMEPLAASPSPPDGLEAGDVLVMVDPRTLEYYAVELRR
jgi:hypothetical protein